MSSAAPAFVGALERLFQEGARIVFWNDADAEFGAAYLAQEHEMIANWIRAQEWGEHVPQSCWKYITTSKRIKSCRNQLRALVRELEADNE